MQQPGGCPSAVVKAACLENRRSRPSSFIETECFSPLIRNDSMLWGTPVTDRWRARPQTARVEISNPVSGGQCHFIHLTILGRFSLLNLAYMYTKVA